MVSKIKTCKRFLWISTIIITLFSCTRENKIVENEAAKLMVGTAIRDITPTEQMLPLTRSPNVEMVGILDPIHVRAIAFSSGGDTTLMICSETGESHSRVASLIAKHTGLPLEAIFSTTTHSHAAPRIKNPLDLDFNGDTKMTNQKIWAKYAIEQTMTAADEALANMKPASMGIGYSKSYINVNRNSLYNKVDGDGKVTEYYDLGYNPTGPSDKTVVAVRFNDVNGNPIAFIINYAVHATVMHANTCINGKTGISSDIPGMISKYLEEKYVGSIAMWTSGAAGDQNPIVQNDMYTRNPETGEFNEKFSDSYDILMYLSKIHFADIETALSNIEDYYGNINVKYDFMKSDIPAKDSGDYPISLQLLRIGDFALVGLPGEPFTSIGMYMKKNSLLQNTMIVTHMQLKEYQNAGYYPDDESIVRGGFGTQANYKTGYLKEGLTSMMNSLIEKTNN